MNSYINLDKILEDIFSSFFRTVEILKKIAILAAIISLHRIDLSRPEVIRYVQLDSRDVDLSEILQALRGTRCFAIDDRSRCSKMHPITYAECGGIRGSTYICNNICYDKAFTRVTLLQYKICIFENS